MPIEPRDFELVRRLRENIESVILGKPEAVKHLVTAMGGRVGMRPADREGSVFWIELRCPREP